MICRLILFVKYLFTFRMQEAKAALDLDKEEVILRNMISKYLSRTPYVREAPKIGRNETCPCGSGINIVVVNEAV